ncbi:MAG TPA: hypothetical protein VIF62_13285, partial [Labilithrix sp.]
MRNVVAALIVLALATFPSAARADDTGAAKLWHDLNAGADLLKTVPSIAVFDGSWSIGLQLGSFLVSNTWRGREPKGAIANEATRVLYGTSWTAMIGLESLGAVLATGGRFTWLAEAEWRTNWMIGLDLPACPSVGAYGGCGIGIGGFGGLHVRPIGSRWWLEASGGWMEQRVATDERRTVAESLWVLTPMTATYAFQIGESPLALRGRAGPGVYFGMHNAHVHPTDLGEQTISTPWHEIYPLDAGLGPGARAEAHVVVMRRFTFDGEIVAAPFFVGGPTTHPSHDVAPLDAPRSGTPVWRYVTAGVSWDHVPVLPMR